MKIYVAGHNGLVGSAITKKIESDGFHSWIGKTRSELDLREKKAVEEFVMKEKPDAIIIAAARVGGIGANSKFPVEFLSENLQIEVNLMEAAAKARIKRLLFLGSSCIYPKFATQPIKEEFLLSGALEQTNEPYAIAKIAGIKLVNAYRSQYGFDWVSAMPCNIYGPGDNFDLQTGHVLPSLIRKFHEAKEEGLAGITLWGSGAPLREFLHVDDLASAVLFLLENHHSDLHINVGSGQEISIRELSQLVSAAVGFKGEILWDDSKPDGTPRKILDSSKIKEMGWTHSWSLSDGVNQTYKWFFDGLLR